MFRILVENRIAQHEGHYRCFFCRLNVSNTYEAILEHINNDHHKQWAEMYKWDKIKTSKELKKLMKLPEIEYQKLVKNGIVFKGTHYSCYCCDGHRSKISLDTHLTGVTHIRNYKDKWYIIDIPLTNDTNIVIESVENSLYYKEFEKQWLSRTLPTFAFKNLKANHIYFNRADNTYKCNICRILIDEPLKFYEHISESSHLEKLKRRKYDLGKKDLFYYCEKCDLYLTLNETLVQCHCLFHLYDELTDLQDDQSNFDIIKINFNKDNVNFKCLLCDEIVYSDNKLAEHLISPRHFEKLDIISIMSNLKDRHVPDRDTEKNYKYDINNYQSNFITMKNFCTTCYYEPDLDGRDHFQKVKPVKKSNIENHSHISVSKDINVYKCFFCNESFDTLKSLLKHFTRRGHIHSMKIFHIILQDPAFKNDEIKIGDLFKKHSDEEKLILKFPYNEDILDFGEKYISKCLESGTDNIYDISDERVRQFHLGASLTYKYKSEILCLVCKDSFPDLPHFLYEHLQHEEHIKNLCAMEKEDKENQNRFSCLDLAKSFMMQDKSDELIICFICNTKILNRDDDIETHTKSDKHVSKIEIQNRTGLDKIENISKIFKDIWYYADQFNCNVCNMKIDREISFAKHLEEPEHLEKLKISDVENKINICFVCSLCWYGSADYSKHYNDIIHVNFLSNCHQSSEKTIKLQKASNLLNSIDDNVLLLLSESDKIVHKKEKEQILLESIEETVKHIYPNAKAYAFGSRSSYLGLRQSSVDVFLDCESVYNGIGKKEASKNYIHKLKNEFFKKRKDIWVDNSEFLYSRVPVMKLYHKALCLKCNISFSSGLEVEKSKLIRMYVIADKDSNQIIRSLILYLRKLFTLRDFNGFQTISEYAISWLVIFYLQTIDILPSVHQLIKLKNESNIVDGWQCGFPESIPKTNINHTVEELLKGFFAYYYHFDYQTNLVCPLLGKELKKQALANIHDVVPEEMTIYKERVNSEELELFRFDSPMCIQDPVDLSQNITDNITKIQLRNFREYCWKNCSFINKPMKCRLSKNLKI